MWVDDDLIFDLDSNDFNTNEGQQLYPQRPEHIALIHEHTWHFYVYIYRYDDYYSVSHLRSLDERLWTDSPYPKINHNDVTEEVTLFQNNSDYVYIRCYGQEYLFNEIKLIKDEITGIGERTDGYYVQDAGRLIVEYWNGSDWQEVENLEDGTAVGGNTLAQDGTITWTALTLEQWSRRWGFISDGGYRWLRLRVENNPTRELKPDFFIPQYSLGIQLDDIEIWDGMPGGIDPILRGDINNDGIVNIQDVQLCVNVILGIETNPEIVQKAKEVAEFLGICNELDLQKIVKIILNQ